MGYSAIVQSKSRGASSPRIHHVKINDISPCGTPVPNGNEGRSRETQFPKLNEGNSKPDGADPLAGRRIALGTDLSQIGPEFDRSCRGYVDVVL